MSTTIRVTREDKERLANLARKLRARSMAEALRKAIEMAEEGSEEFRGNLDALRKTLAFSAERGGGISERVDEELAKVLDERREG